RHQGTHRNARDDLPHVLPRPVMGINLPNLSTTRSPGRFLGQRGRGRGGSGKEEGRAGTPARGAAGPPPIIARPGAFVAPSCGGAIFPRRAGLPAGGRGSKIGPDGARILSAP